MNNLKKLGLAVAGSTLVASSAYAGALDVSGNAKISMKSADDDEVTGNSFLWIKELRLRDLVN